jgi:hypothetical protein
MLLLQYFPSCSLSTSTVESDPRQQTERQIRFQLPSVLFLPIFSAFAFWHSPIQDEASLSHFFYLFIFLAEKIVPVPTPTFPFLFPKREKIFDSESF